jgi:hypothetical protein
MTARTISHIPAWLAEGQWLAEARPIAPTKGARLWQQFRDLWVDGGASLADPRLAADARQPAMPERRYLSPLIGAWLH